VRFRVVVASVILLCALLRAQTKVRAQPKPQPPPRKDDLTSAREATDRFLNGVKLAELPEGRQLLSETQWITGDADNGENFYLRPRFTEVTSLFEKLFDTDVPGVQGYKRLSGHESSFGSWNALLTRYSMVAFKDRRTNKWKVLDTGTDENADVDRQVAYFGQRYLGGTVPVEPTQKVQVYNRTCRSTLIQTGSLTERTPRSTRR